jgi:hypothetical protein
MQRLGSFSPSTSLDSTANQNYCGGVWVSRAIEPEHLVAGVARMGEDRTDGARGPWDSRPVAVALDVWNRHRTDEVPLDVENVGLGLGGHPR